MSFARVAIIGLGLLGGSIGLAVRQHLPGVVTSGYDADPAARAKASARGLADSVCDSAAEAVADADLVILSACDTAAMATRIVADQADVAKHGGPVEPAKRIFRRHTRHQAVCPDQRRVVA